MQTPKTSRSRRSRARGTSWITGSVRAGCALAGLALSGVGFGIPALVSAEEPAVAAQVPPGPPGVVAVPIDAPAVEGGRFAFTPEQQEKLRLAQEAQARRLLGLAPEAPIPSEAELTEAQKRTLHDARDAELRRVLGLGPADPLPNRASVTPEQRAKIAAAHEARLREALGLGPEDPLPLAAPPAPAAPAPGAGR